MTHQRVLDGPVCHAASSGGLRPDFDDLPPVLLTSNDLRRLRALIMRARHETDDSVLQFLVRELDRAVVCQPDLIPADVVTMNSRVFFRRHIGQPVESRTLVYDGNYAVLGGAIPILTPLGVALLGLRDGSQMPYLSLQGVRYIARVERVAYQPEGDGRLLRAPWRYWPRPKVAGSDAERASPALPRRGRERRYSVASEIAAASSPTSFNRRWRGSRAEQRSLVPLKPGSGVRNT